VKSHRRVSGVMDSPADLLFCPCSWMPLGAWPGRSSPVPRWPRHGCRGRASPRRLAGGCGRRATAVSRPEHGTGATRSQGARSPALDCSVVGGAAVEGRRILGEAGVALRPRSGSAMAWAWCRGRTWHGRFMASRLRPGEPGARAGRESSFAGPDRPHGVRGWGFFTVTCRVVTPGF